MSLHIGDTIDSYRITDTIGSGAIGQVYRVEHVITGRAEALKVRHHARPETPEEAQRFLREIRVHARLSHPNIVALHNALWHGSDLVMVLELVEGQSLEALLERGRLPFQRAIELFRQALSALAYAHSNGVTHRDISPSNMLVTHDGTLKLMDFGLAVQPDDLRLTLSGAPLGSPYYMSPEQVLRASLADARSDIYSAGCVLYEMVTGTRPFAQASVFEVMQAQVQHAAAPVHELDSACPAALSRVIARAMAKSPRDRFASAVEFREAMELALSGVSAPKAAETETETVDVVAAAAPVVHSSTPVASEPGTFRFRPGGKAAWSRPLAGIAAGLMVFLAGVSLLRMNRLPPVETIRMVTLPLPPPPMAYEFTQVSEELEAAPQTSTASQRSYPAPGSYASQGSYVGSGTRRTSVAAKPGRGSSFSSSTSESTKLVPRIEPAANVETGASTAPRPAQPEPPPSAPAATEMNRASPERNSAWNQGAASGTIAPPAPERVKLTMPHEPDEPVSEAHAEPPKQKNWLLRGLSRVKRLGKPEPNSVSGSTK